MKRIVPRIEPTADGSPTLRHPVLGDTYHSVRGAMGESDHVFIRNGLLWLAAERKTRQGGDASAAARDGLFCILEVGFGSGLNAWLTARAAAEAGLGIRYEALEPYPVADEVTAALDYAADPLFMALHRAPWEEEVAVTADFTLKKRAVPLADCPFDATFDLVYFDAFAPETQPELWTAEAFGALFAALAPGGALVTYSAKGTVKENLRAAGFTVRRLPGALGKRHMLRAQKPTDDENR